MIVIIQCSDRVGLVAAISQVLAKKGINIISMREYVDKTDNLFFARFDLENVTDVSSLQAELHEALPVDATIKINPRAEKRIIVFVTKEYHCLGDILIRNYFKTLKASVLCVVGNHSSLENICNRFDVPFHFITHEGKDKAVFENAILEILQQHEFDYIVLAKFMRILSPEFVSQFPKRIINIHHSFLPAFAGASPYRQAFERGVKLIGATAHFVTDNLDEGPIIAQQTIEVNHNFNVADMIRAGKEIETSVLAKALQFVFDDRVFVHQNKTVVFE